MLEESVGYYSHSPIKTKQNKTKQKNNKKTTPKFKKNTKTKQTENHCKTTHHHPEKVEKKKRERRRYISSMAAAQAAGPGMDGSRERFCCMSAACHPAGTKTPGRCEIVALVLA